MERGEKQSTLSSQRKKIEPTFVPEWLKTTATVMSGTGNSNHISGSSLHSDDHAAGILSRSRLPVNACELDSHHSPIITERSSLSYHRSSSTNGSLNHDKDNSLHSRPYSSFGRSARDRDREKDVDFRDREKLIKLENGFHDFPDSFMSGRAEKDTLRRSQSMVSGRRSDSWTKRAGNGTASFISGGSIVTTINKASFDREFPSLGAEDNKQGPPEMGRVSSPGLSSAIQSLPLGSSALIGGDGWTSALAEVPVIIGGNGPSFSSVQQAAPACTSSTVSSSTTGLNMAETLAQAPSRARAAPQLSVDTQKLEELAIKQSRQLIPMTPSMPKTSVLSSSEKLKPKGSRSDFGTLPKVGQQPSSQLVNHALRGSSRPDISKPSQVGNFQVLNREKNGLSPTSRDGPSLTNVPGVLNPLGVVPAAATAPPLKTPNNLKIKADGKATSLPVTTFMEKRPVTQQNRSEFFNSLRKKTSVSNTTSTPEPCSCQSTFEKSDERNIGASSAADAETKGISESDSGLDFSMGKSSSAGGGTNDVCKDSERFPPVNGEKSSCLDPAEEVRLLRLLGWKENAGEEEEALTAEEIDAFIEEYQKLRPSSKFSRRALRLANSATVEDGDGGSPGSSSADSKTEGF